MVVGELVVMSKTGSQFARDYEEAPLEMLLHQAEFNVISRFPEHDRVDSVGICRIDSVALKAYKRYGYIDTGATYTDEHGTPFRIIYKPLFPADVILGYRDIE
jgi:hypothetical protein